MSDIIRVQDQFYILATSSFADDRTRVLKHGETFAVFDRYGDIQPVGIGEQGIFLEGTRFLSRLVFRLDSKRPLLLSSTVKQENDLFAVDLTNPDFMTDSETLIARGTLYFYRTKFLWNGNCYERLRISNFGLEPVDIPFVYEFDADFADIFEVRGIARKQKGILKESRVEDNCIVFCYEGLDQKTRETWIHFSPEPKELDSKSASFQVRLAPHQEATFFLTLSCRMGNPSHIHTDSFENAFEIASSNFKRIRNNHCRITSSNVQFNDWLNRSVSDLAVMITETPYGLYPYAGVPWFSTPFGRDGIITALQTLWLFPDLARGVLNYLAATQAKEINPERDAEPGKILHESRQGEMAALNEIPFGRYYGSVDSTPLFVLLAGEYFKSTHDVKFIRQILPNIEAALLWIDQYGDLDHDGFVEYARKTPKGLVQQGWKDSEDSVFHSGGAIAEAPIALCEVQAYVYGAKQLAGEMMIALGEREKGMKLLAQAQKIKEKFAAEFWIEEMGSYALALDGYKKPCKVRTSNAGQCLYTGIASAEHAQRIAVNLLSPEFFSGWGIRTLAVGEVRYNPMSYHNGSVWPHDNSIIAAGLSRYGFQSYSSQVFAALFDASLVLDLHRLPELYCGFSRRTGEGIVNYPVACSPQAWATASIFLLLQSCLGIRIQPEESKLYLSQPVLPSFLQEIQISNLKVGENQVDLLLQRNLTNVAVNVLRRSGPVQVITSK
jgi:glycogen debranching enzyme